MSIHRDRTKIKKSKKSEWKLNNKKNHQKRCTFLYLRDAIENLGGKKGEIKWNGNLPAKKKKGKYLYEQSECNLSNKDFRVWQRGNETKCCETLCGALWT